MQQTNIDKGEESMAKIKVNLFIVSIILFIIFGFCYERTFADTIDNGNQTENNETLVDNNDETESTNNNSLRDSMINCLGATAGGIITAIITQLLAVKIKSIENKKEHSTTVITKLINDFYSQLQKRNVDVIGEAQSFINKITATHEVSFSQEVTIWNRQIMRRHSLTKLAEEISAEIKKLDDSIEGKTTVINNISHLLENYLKGEKGGKSKNGTK